MGKKSGISVKKRERKKKIKKKKDELLSTSELLPWLLKPKRSASSELSTSGTVDRLT